MGCNEADAARSVRSPLRGTMPARLRMTSFSASLTIIIGFVEERKENNIGVDSLYESFRLFLDLINNKISNFIQVDHALI